MEWEQIAYVVMLLGLVFSCEQLFKETVMRLILDITRTANDNKVNQSRKTFFLQLQFICSDLVNIFIFVVLATYFRDKAKTYIW